MAYRSITYSGYSLVELVIVIAIISVLATLVLIGIPDSQARARDVQRTSDINSLHTRLEEYYTDKGAYPDTLSDDHFPGLDPEAKLDPSGVAIAELSPVANQAEAVNSSNNPTGTPNDYLYIPYPTGCGSTSCRGYVLKSYIEKPGKQASNPYIRSGLSNN